jgi:dienelactone hydrolase
MSLMPKPTQCHFGSKDDHSGFSDPAAAAELKRLLERSGCTLEFHTYHGLGHGFMNGDTEWGRDMNSRLVSASE